jgi:hypothetical protein
LVKHEHPRKHDARYGVDQDRDPGAEHPDRGHLRPADRRRAKRERLENRRVARVDGERVPLRGRDERGDDHREREIARSIVERRERSLSGCEPEARVPERAKRAQKRGQRDDARADDRQQLRAVGVRRDQVVFEKRPKKVARENGVGLAGADHAPLLGAQGRHVGQIARDLFRIFLDDELRKDAFERVPRQQRPQVVD